MAKREQETKLLTNLKAALPEFEKLLEKCDADDMGPEDYIYRFYHQSFKVYSLQSYTGQIVEKLKDLLPDAVLNPYFLEILKQGTGKKFDMEHNRRWLEVTRPIVEAYFHAHYFLKMAVKYGKELDAPPAMLPSGWAAFLYLYNLR